LPPIENFSRIAALAASALILSTVSYQRLAVAPPRRAWLSVSKDIPHLPVAKLLEHGVSVKENKAALSQFVSCVLHTSCEIIGTATKINVEYCVRSRVPGRQISRAAKSIDADSSPYPSTTSWPTLRRYDRRSSAGQEL
jgi:hypothetical protein